MFPIETTWCLSTISLSSSLYHSCQGGCSCEPIKHWRLTLWTVSWPAILTHDSWAEEVMSETPTLWRRLELVKTCPPSWFFPGHSRSAVLSWRMRPHALQDFGTDNPHSVTFDSVFKRWGVWDFLPFSPLSTQPHLHREQQGTDMSVQNDYCS